jgi:hypothetical protein
MGVLVTTAATQGCSQPGSSNSGARGPVIRVGDAGGAPGSTVEVSVVMSATGGAVAALRYDLTYDPKRLAAVMGADGTPDCRLGSQVGPGSRANKQLRANLIEAGDGGTKAVRVVILGMNSEPIPDGEVVSCKFGIDPGASSGTTEVVGSADAANSKGQTQGVATAAGSVTIH